MSLNHANPPSPVRRDSGGGEPAGWPKPGSCWLYPRSSSPLLSNGRCTARMHAAVAGDLALTSSASWRVSTRPERASSSSTRSRTQIGRRWLPYRVRPNIRRHVRQLWRYIEADECLPFPVVMAAIHVPMTPSGSQAAEVEAGFAEEGISVVWGDG